ncbi:AsmA family protein [Stutzerimonas frequens]|uniref:AsmA family protein n=1 Tax=Stutzerimonas frequens TaxID=2968969 RepID=A0ABX6XYL4_9GAMM|nr:AsmA family protein [Stutzerimonas frequens]
MSKATPWLLAGLAGILVLLGGLALLAESPWARQLIERQLSQRLDGRAVSIGEFDIEWGLPLGVQLRDLRIANADWASDAPLLTLDALRARLGVGALLTGDVQLRSLQLVQPQVHLARQADGQTNWAAPLGDGPEQGSLPFSPDPLRIRDGEIHYRDAQLDLQLDLSVATPPSDEGPRRLNVEGSGQFRGRPVSLTLIGDPPARALAADAPYTLSLNAQLGALQLRFEGQSASLPSLEQLQGRLTASASDAMAFDALPIDLPPLRLQANTRRDGSQWALSDIDLRTNGSHLTGAASVQAGSEPRVAIRLEGDQLDLDRWGLMPRPTRTGERRPMAADRLLGNARDLLERAAIGRQRAVRGGDGGRRRRPPGASHVGRPVGQGRDRATRAQRGRSLDRRAHQRRTYRHELRLPAFRRRRRHCASGAVLRQHPRQQPDRGRPDRPGHRAVETGIRRPRQRLQPAIGSGADPTAWHLA